MAEDGVTHSIVSFLERPVHFKTGKWSSGDVRGSALCKIDIPTDIVKLPMYKNKLNYLLGLRADFKIRVQVNSQPFQAGRLILSWVPFLKMGDKIGLQQRNVYYNALAEKNLTPISGCPRTEIDLSTTTEATMNIPYISPFSYYHLPTLAGDFGRFQLVVYSPLVDTVSSGVVDYSVWVSMHNVKAEFPTGVEIKSVAQIGDEATTENKQGIVESTFSKFSQSLKLFRDIPLLSNYIRPAIWTSDKVTDVAKIFGWSKPHSVSDISLVQQNTARYMANYDGIDMSTNMGFSASNEIEQTPGLFRTDVDEMSLAHILRTPNYYTRFEWTKTDLSDKLLFSTFINPLLYGFIIDDKKKLLAPTHLSYLARHFVLWRGGLNFTFKFVKTKFHSGRIRLAFIPGTFDKEVKVENLNFDANYSTVVDLRSQTEITFNVPFVSIVPWLQCQNLESTGPIITTTTGRLVMIVLNELVPASSVSDKIDVLVEVAAAEDFEFAIPVKPNLAPYSEPPKVKRSLVETLSTMAQVGVDTVVPVPFEDLQKQGTTGAVEVSNHKTHTDMMVCANTVGEKVTSVRQLIKRFYRAGKYKEDVKVAMLRIFPYSFYSPISDSTKADSWCEECTSLDTFAYLYAFFRGSIRYKIIQEKFTKPSYSYLLPASFSDEDLPRGVLGYADKEIPPGMHRSKGSQKIHFPQLDGLAELQIPYYSLYPFSVVGTTDKCNLATANNGYRSFNSLAYYPKDTTRLDVYTAAGDDFSFAFLLGAPWIIEGELPPQK